jgi:GTP-binding protein
VIDHVAAQVNATLPTGLLNRTLSAAMARAQPPSYRGRPTKLFYATQLGTAPIRIRGFVTHAKAIPSSYEQYLVKSLRRSFGLEGAPVFFQWRNRRSEEKR